MSVQEEGTQEPQYELLGANIANPNWDGSPLTLAVNDTALMPQTTNGSMVLAYQNSSTKNNQGTLIYTTGGAPPVSLPVQALANQPSILVNNWHANNLKLTNASANSDTPIWTEAFGPGIPGFTVLPLQIGTPLSVDPVKVAQGTANPNWMQLVLTSGTGTLSIIALIGGPQDGTGNNAYVFALNAATNTGPGTDLPAPPGYYATTTGNSLTYQMNWGSSTVYVANMSPSTATPVSVLLRSL